MLEIIENLQLTAASHKVKTLYKQLLLALKGMSMTREYDEKRDFIRIDIDCEIEFKKIDSTNGVSIGQILNLSGRGMMFVSEVELEKNNVFEINVKPSNALTPSLHANVKVVRVVKQRHASGYEIGAVIKEIYDDNE